MPRPQPPWPVQVKETDSFHVAKVARREEGTEDDIIVLLPTVEGAGRRCHMRSLGYIGSFLLAYRSAQVGRRVGAGTAGTVVCVTSFAASTPLQAQASKLVLLVLQQASVGNSLCSLGLEGWSFEKPDTHSLGIEGW